MSTESKIKAPIVEVFRSLEGEGLFLGTPTVFVRLAGCNVGCRYCDSKLTWDTNNWPDKTIAQVAQQVKRLIEKTGIERISITGGEPLLHSEFVMGLCEELCTLPVINLETSGTIFNDELFTNLYNLQVSMDIKTPSSGVVLSEVVKRELRDYARQEYIYFKAVVNSKEDLKFLVDLDVLDSFNTFVLTPCEIDNKFFDPNQIMNYFYTNKIPSWNIRIIAQQHKMLNYR